MTKGFIAGAGGLKVGAGKISNLIRKQEVDMKQEVNIKTQICIDE
jgi:hypothetical protein